MGKILKNDDRNEQQATQLTQNPQQRFLIPFIILVDGFSLRVFKNGEITSAFRAYHELAERMDDYPILDESDYSNREYEATLDNIKDAAWRLKNDFDLPDGWECEVYSWLSEHRSVEIENKDDSGGYPRETARRSAFKELGFKEQE